MSDRFDSLWSLMSKYKFEVDPDSINDDLVCIICKNLMIDACQAVCGCQYCSKCISEYLTDGDKFCPGGKVACGEEYLVMDRDILKNVRLNNKIFKLRVICPNECCKYICELSKMEDHIRICTIETALCPYTVLGCDKLQNHLRNDPLAHTQLLIDWINNVKNEVDGLKERLEKTDLENLSIKNKSEERHSEMTEKMMMMKREIMTTKDEIKNKSKIIVKLEKESRNKDSTILSLNEKLTTTKTEIELKLSSMLAEIENREQDIAALKGNCDRMEKELIEIKKSLEKNSNKSKLSVNKRKLLNDTSKIDLDFMWTFEKLSWKRKNQISDGYYTKGYKLCLSVYLATEGIYVWCYIMKGNNDDKRQWPMLMAVTLSIVNQNTLKAQRSLTFQYNTYNYDYRVAFERPTGVRNVYSIGSSSPISYSSFDDIDSIIVNDSIIVAYTLSDP